MLGLFHMQVEQIGGGGGLSIQSPPDWSAPDRRVFMSTTAVDFTFCNTHNILDT